MNHPIITGVLLAAAALAVLVGVLGMALVRGAAARLHFVSAVSLVAPVLMIAAMLCENGLSQAGIKAILIGFVVWVEGPVVAHVVGRAIHAHERLSQREREEPE